MGDNVVVTFSSGLSWTYKNAYPGPSETFSDINVGNMAKAISMQKTSNAEDELNAQSAAMQETSNRIAQLNEWMEAPNTQNFPGAVAQSLYEANALDGQQFQLTFSQPVMAADGTLRNIPRTVVGPDDILPVPADYPSQDSLVGDKLYRRQDGSYFYANVTSPGKVTEYELRWSTASAKWPLGMPIAEHLPKWQEAIKADYKNLSQISATQLNLLAATQLGYEQTFGLTSGTIDKNQRTAEGILRNIA